MRPESRQFLGRCDAYHPVSAAAALHRLHHLPDRQRRAADHGGRRQYRHVGGRAPVDPAGPRGEPEAIKMLGTNGGGFFNANSAHPFENPTALTNFVQMLSIFVIGFGLTWCFGKAVGNTRQGWAILSAMILLFWAARRSVTGRKRRVTPCCTSWASRAAIWRARRSASASPPRPCSRPSPRRHRAARSTRCMTASPRSAA